MTRTHTIVGIALLASPASAQFDNANGQYTYFAEAMFDGPSGLRLSDQRELDIGLSRDNNDLPLQFSGDLGVDAQAFGQGAEINSFARVELSRDFALFDLQLSGHAEAFDDAHAQAAVDYNVQFGFGVEHESQVEINLLLEVIGDDLDEGIVNSEIRFQGNRRAPLVLDNFGENNYFAELSFTQSVRAGDSFDLFADLDAQLDGFRDGRIDQVRLLAEVRLLPAPGALGVLAGGGLVAARRRRA